MTCCLKRRNVNGDSPANAQQNLHRTVSTYSETRHRALIALRCAASHRPFNLAKDPLYLEEVEMLRPGTTVPAPSTVSRDLQTIYQKGSKLVGRKVHRSEHFWLRVRRILWVILYLVEGQSRILPDQFRTILQKTLIQSTTI